MKIRIDGEEVVTDEAMDRAIRWSHDVIEYEGIDRDTRVAQRLSTAYYRLAILMAMKDDHNQVRALGATEGSLFLNRIFHAREVAEGLLDELEAYRRSKGHSPPDSMVVNGIESIIATLGGGHDK